MSDNFAEYEQKILNNTNILNTFIGKDYNKETINQINKIFTPFTVQLCNPSDYYLQNFRFNTIRCLVQNDKIYKLCFH